MWVELGDADMDFASVTLIAVALDAFKYSMAAHFSACFAMSDLAPLGLLRSQRCPPQNKGPAAKPAPGYAEANAHYRQLAQRFRPRQRVLACEQSVAIYRRATYLDGQKTAAPNGSFAAVFV